MCSWRTRPICHIIGDKDHPQLTDTICQSIHYGQTINARFRMGPHEKTVDYWPFRTHEMWHKSALEHPQHHHRRQHYTQEWGSYKSHYSWHAEYPIWFSLHLNEGIEILLGEKMCCGLMQRAINSGVFSIITPLSRWDLCLNEAYFLPDAISFYPACSLKADQWE